MGTSMIGNSPFSHLALCDAHWAIVNATGLDSLPGTGVPAKSDLDNLRTILFRHSVEVAAIPVFRASGLNHESMVWMRLGPKVGWCISSITLLVGLSGAAQAIPYENHNQVDPSALAVPGVMGWAHDDQGVAMPRVCLGLFSERSHTLLAVVQTADDGTFPGIANGKYRLVATSPGFCSANVPIAVQRGAFSYRRIDLHMKVGGIDIGSFGTISR